MINNIVPYKEGIINKISNWFKKIFFRRKDNQEVEEKNGVVFYSETLRDRVFIPEDKEKNRVLNLRKKWEEGEIDAEDISDEDVKNIVELYNKETEKIKDETSQIKENIAKMLKELKNFS